MDKIVSNIFIQSLRQAIGKNGKVEGEFSPEALWNLASLHDLAHLVSVAFSSLGCQSKFGEYLDKFTSAQVKAVFRHVKIVKELGDMASAFEREGVDFIFLKGSKMRFFYPEPWMRTSSDIDLLVRGGFEDKAKEVLLKLNYKYLGEWRYERRYDTPSGVHIEVHTDLSEGEGVVDQKLKEVWNTAVVEDGYKHKYVMSDEFFRFYHVVHMAKHFSDGGCGVRPFIDLFVLKDRGENDDFYKMLEEVNLVKFYAGVKSLCDSWFGDGDCTETDKMEEFVIRGGLFGTYENAVDVKGKKGKFRYLLGRAFPPFVNMKEMYPTLKKHKWLLPIFYVARWFKVLVKLIAGKARDELKAINNMDEKRVEDTQKLFDSLGLH